MLLEAAVGVERQWRQNYAGVVTHTVGLPGAAAYTSRPALLDAGSDMRLGSQVVACGRGPQSGPSQPDINTLAGHSSDAERIL